MMIYVGNLKESINIRKKIPELSEFSVFAGFNINTEKLVVLKRY